MNMRLQKRRAIAYHECTPSRDDPYLRVIHRSAFEPEVTSWAFLLPASRDTIDPRVA